MRWIFISVFVVIPLCLYGQTAPGVVQELSSEEDLIKAMESYSDGKYTEAISILKKYTEKNPQDKDALILLGKSFVYSGDCSGGLNVFKKIEPLFDQNDKYVVYMDIAQCYIQDKRYKEASEYLTAIQRSAPDNEKAIFLLGTLKIAQGDYKGARPLFEDIYGKSQVYKGRAAYYLAVIAQRENKIDDALKLIDVAAKDNNSKEGREAKRILENIKSEKEKYEKKSSIRPFFKFRNSYVFDSNVPEMAENEDENIKYLTNLGNVSTRWGVRTDLELSGGVNYKKKGHRANAVLMYFSNFHFLPINSIIPRSEFDANYYDIMFIYAGTRYNYDLKINKNILSAGLELGLLNLFTDQFGSLMREENTEAGPNFYLTSLRVAPNISFAIKDIIILKPYYRSKMDFYHQSIKDADLNSMSGVNHSLGIEASVGFRKTGLILLRFFEYDKNSADGSQWRYSGIRTGLGLSIVALSMIDIRLVAEYFLRDFSDSSYVLEDGSLSSRSDKRLSLNLGPELLFGSGGRFGLKYNFILNHSNIEVYDYIRHLGIMFWEIRF